MQLIKETQNLPTHSLVFLMVPTFNCKHELRLEGNPDMISDFIGSSAECSAAASRDMQKTILKIAL